MRRASMVRSRRAGATLVELMLALVIMMVVMGAAVSFFRVQARAAETGAGRLEALQSLRAVQSLIDRELRLAGGITGQPVIVYADAMALSFNVDLVTRTSGDRSAVYYNPDADSLSANSWEPAQATTLPGSVRSYPTASYLDDGGNRSPAETVTFFLLPDASTSRADAYSLFRRVNDRDSTVVARNLIVPSDSSFFRYWRTDASGVLSAVASASLPLYWDNASGVTDSLRVVDLRISTWFRDGRANRDVIRTMTSSVKLLNAGLLRLETCGVEPLPARSPAAALITDADGAPVSVRVSWTPSLEEGGGERDVALYFIQRRPSAGGSWTILSNHPATGAGSYTFDDQPPVSGSWQYAVVAQDCSPANSTPALTATVVVP
ncbi:MAG: prepilin-type N-terminal cleavage/methylation domain-containing protein [Gemmatimonadota bacterium]|nr:prepilin-type N-terminal cleavage/methylation domain-containing protein [Gemmatimonadota bacterium]